MEIARRTFSLIVSAVLALALVPFAPASAHADEPSAWPNNIPELLTANGEGGYNSGEAIALVADSGISLFALNDDEDLLGNAEQLMDMSASAVVEATGQNLPNNGIATLSLENEAAEPQEATVRAVLVKSDTLSTEELLRALAEDPRVVSAEPNYIYQLPESESSSEIISGDSVAQSSSDDAASGDTGGSAEEDASANDANPEGSGNTGSTESSTEDALPFEPLAVKATQLDTDFDTSLTDLQWAYQSNDTSLTGLRNSEGDTAQVNIAGWNATEGKGNADGITVAVFDSGVDYTHADLKNVMADLHTLSNWSQLEAAGFGKYGYNSVDGAPSTTDPMDDNGHGTHCAGIIGAQWNEYGVSGAADGVDIVAFKSASTAGQFTSSSLLRGYSAMSKAVDAGVQIRIANNSWSASMLQPSISSAITELGQKGVVSVFASGNYSTDIDAKPATSSSLSNNPYVVVVNSNTINGQVSGFSNYGANTTNLFAPGSGIFSTVPEKTLSYWPQGSNKETAYDSFENAEEGSRAFELYKSGSTEYGSFELGDKITTASISDDASFQGGHSLKISRSEFTPNGYGQSIILKVNISGSDENDFNDKVNNIAVTQFSALYTGTSRIGMIQEIEGWGKKADSEEKFAQDMADLQGAFVGGNEGWNTYGINLQSVAKALKERNGLEDAGIGVHVNDDGKSGYILMKITAVTSSLDGDLYLDLFGMGYKTSGYASMSGTSMATPCVAGATAILMHDYLANNSAASPSEAARTVALDAKTRVSAPEGVDTNPFVGKCTSGGMLDMTATGEQSNPAILSASVNTSGSTASVTLKGSALGSTAGTITVGGMTANVTSWSDDSVTFAWPTGLASGVYEVALTTAGGKTCSYASIFDVAGTTDTALFEDNIGLWGSDFEVFGIELIGLGGDIYAFPFDIATMVAHANAGFNSVKKYNTASGVWEDAANLPAFMSSLSLTLHNGKIFAIGTALNDTATAFEEKGYLYDPTTNSWEECPHITNDMLSSGIVNTGQEILLVGGDEMIDGLTSTKTANNIVALNPETGETRTVGTLSTPRSSGVDTDSCNMQLIAKDDAVYVATGVCNEIVTDAAGKKSVSTKGVAAIEKLTRNADGTYTSTPLPTTVLPETASSIYDASYGLAVGKSELIVSAHKTLAAGATKATGALSPASPLLAKPNTYSISETSYEPFAKNASFALLQNPSSLAYNGKLYVFGASLFENPSYIFRATALETNATPGDIVTPGPTPDPTPTPDPETGGSIDENGKSASAKTGDTTGKAIAPLAAMLALTCAAGMALALRRIKSQD